MARKKEYIEKEVLDKAMNLFWHNGYEATSMNMLENEMGINKFSIYSSFGSKKGVFLESVKCYRNKLSTLLTKLRNSGNGADGIKSYFYEFVEFSKVEGSANGCLVTNTANQLNEKADPEITSALNNFTLEVRKLFIDNLALEDKGDEKLIEELADYLIISMFGLSSASRIFNKIQLQNYIENIFRNI